MVSRNPTFEISDLEGGSSDLSRVRLAGSIALLANPDALKVSERQFWKQLWPKSREMTLRKAHQKMIYPENVGSPKL